MKSIHLVTIIALAALIANPAKSQHDPIEMGLRAITKDAIKGQLDFLASDWTEGRETTTEGEFLAGDFISTVFQIYGLQPAGDFVRGRYIFGVRGDAPKRNPDSWSFFQDIPFIQTLKDESYVEIISKQGQVEHVTHLKSGDMYVYEGNPNLDITSPAVFIGYGYKNDAIGYDDFKGLDLKGKIVLQMSGYPGAGDTLSKAYKKLNIQDRMEFNRSLRALKEKLLIEHEVAGYIRVPGFSLGGSSYANYPFRINRPTYEGKRGDGEDYRDIYLPADSAFAKPMMILMNPEYVNTILDGSGIDLKEYQKNAANLKAGSKEIPGKTIHVKRDLENEKVLGRNVLAKIEGENPDEIIVVGAHYDHLGMYNDVIYNGADDNASGTVGVMTLAKAFMATGVKPKKTIVFAAWTGEEKGLLGSTYFMSKYPDKEKVVLNLNFDMISRRPEKDTSGFKADMDFTQGYPVLQELVEKANAKYELGLDIKFNPSEKPTGGTDYTPFAEKDIPIYGFNAAFTSDYHQATDHSEKADHDLMQKIIKVGFITLFELANTEGKID